MLSHIAKKSFARKEGRLSVFRSVFFSTWGQLFEENPIFAHSKTGNFTQERPTLGNQYTEDPVLRKYVQRTFPREVLSCVEDDLFALGDAVGKEIFERSITLDESSPQLRQYDAWGKRVDEIIMHHSWGFMHDVAAREGLISIPYAKKYGEWSRVYQAVKLFLFAPSSGLYSCPLAMTDGAASILQNLDRKPFTDAFKRLTSTDPKIFWTSGQWMTEKRGGSDVGDATDTVAVRTACGVYKLYGFKWFTSATDANMSLTLARIVGSDKRRDEMRSKGVTMFYLETKDEHGSLNGIQIEKFKNKLGTRQMPTAELILDGSVAHQISDEGRGIAAITPMLTLTRIHNAISASSAMRRMLNLSKDFARKRVAFRKRLDNHPLHMQTLCRMEVEQQASFFFTMEVVRLLGLEENKMASDRDVLLLRLLTPLLKLYTAKQAVAVSSEGLESFGGHGYLEDSGLPKILRDAQVLSIWEGTTNILALDVLRSIAKTNGEVLVAFESDVCARLEGSTNVAQLKIVQQNIKQALHALMGFVQSSLADHALFQLAARDFAYSLARVYMAALLYSHACSEPTSSLPAVALRWTLLQDLAPVSCRSKAGMYSSECSDAEKRVVYDSDQLP